jgi:predicted Zn-dependent protease
MPGLRLRAAAWTAAVCSVAAIWPSVSRGTEVEPFSLTAAALLEFASSPVRHDEHAVAFRLEALRYEFDERHRLTITTHQIYRIDAPEAVESYGQIGSVWEPYRQTKPVLRARVVTPGGREHQFDPATLSDETVATGDARKFDDLHYLRGPLPAIANGSVVEILAVVADVEPKFPSGSSFDVLVGAHGAVESTSVTVVTPRSLPFKYRTELLPQAVISEEDAGAARRFTLRQGPLVLDWNDTYVEASGPAPFWPRLEFSTAGSWGEVAAAYANLVEPTIRPDEVRQLLPADLPADTRQRITRLLGILHERVRYTGVFFGQGDIVPNAPSVTLERRFGDCKDKSVVLASLLRAAGVPAHVVLLKSGVGTDVNPEVPGIGSFNHMIVHVPGEGLWLDATAEFLGASDAPYENSGRWALVIGAPEHSLMQTPAAQPAGSREVEQRIVRLADIGPGEVQVLTRINGSDAAVYRQLADRDSKEHREDLLEQFRESFSAKSVSGFEVREDAAHGGVSIAVDLHHVEAAATNLQESGIVMSLADLFAKLPYGLRSKPAAGTGQSDAAGSASRPETRTLDWVFQPFISEMEVRVFPPSGFKLRSVPASVESMFGPLVLTQSYREEADGSLAGTIRANSMRGRYTADEGRALREAYLAAESSLLLAVRFDHESWRLARNGQPAAALRRHEQLIEAEPRKAIPLVRAAAQLLEFGLVDEAAAHAERATRVEPASAWAHNMLGTVHQNDEIGRRLRGPFDRAASLKALREAVRLDPANLDMRLNLAATAEHNAQGWRFGKGSDLDLAAEAYRFIVEKRPDWQDGTNYLIQVLWQQRKYADVISAADKVENNQFTASARLAARVKQVGADAALREDASRTDAAGHHARAGAAMVLHLTQRNYDEARALLGAVGAGALPQGASNFIELLENIKVMERQSEPQPTAAGMAEFLVNLMFGDPVEEDDLLPWLSEKARSDDDVAILMSEFAKASRYVSAGVAARIGGSPEFIRDLVLSNLSVQEAPFAERARRVTVTLGGARVGAFYLVEEQSNWKLLAMNVYAPPVTREAHRLLEAGDTAGARAWLAAVKSEIEAVPNSEMGAYRYFLAALPTTSSLDDAAALRLAALALLVVSSPQSADVEDLRRAADGLTTAAQQEVLEAARFAIGWESRDGALALQAAENLEKLKPGSAEGMRARVLAYEVTGRWQDAEQASRTWVAQRPGDAGAKQALVRALNGQGRYADALELLAPEVRAGTADAAQLNNYAWQALRAGTVDDFAVKAAENSSAQRQRRDYSSSHTLACLYADQGRVGEARRVLLQLLDDQPMVDPLDGEIWLIRGLIAESLGETEAATRSYRQIEKPESSSADSVFAIAETRIARLEGRSATRAQAAR